MGNKLRDNSGFSIVEMLCVVIILVMLCLLTDSGLAMAMKSYRDVTAESEIQLLLSDLSDALSDRLRYSIVTVRQEEKTEPDGSISTITKECIFSLENVELKDGGEVSSIWKLADESDPGNPQPAGEGWINDAGQFMAGTKRLLSTGAYGSERSGKRRYEVDTVSVTWDNGVTPAAPATAPGLNDLSEGQTITFCVTIKVRDGWGHISGETTFTVRCLNPVRKEVS